MGRRLLQSFQQSVKRPNREHMDLVDNINPVFRSGRRKGSFLPQVSDIFYAIIAGGVNFHHIHHGAVINSHTALTFSTRIALL